MHKLCLLFIGIALSSIVKAETICITEANQFVKEATVQNEMLYFEDAANTLTIKSILENEELFKSYNNFEPSNPLSTYWITFKLENKTSREYNLHLSFKSLSLVDLFEIKGDSIKGIHHAGLFRNKKDLSGDDYRNKFKISVLENELIKYYIKVNHSKGYIPKFEFFLQDEIESQIQEVEFNRLNYFIFGAYCIFFLFLLILSSINQYKPYFYLAIFTLGMALYGFAMSGHLVYLFPAYPELLWRLNPVFAIVSAVGGLFLINTFLNLKETNLRLYHLIRALIIMLAIQVFISQAILHFSGNYKAMTNILLISLLISFPIILYVSTVVWTKLGRPQKIFVLAIYFYATFLLVAFFFIFFYHEQSTLVVSWITYLCGLIVIIVFTLALGHQMRFIEIEKNETLLELDRIKTKQNRKLEELVDSRTRELLRNNKKLIAQKQDLSTRNDRIELLLRELHHRVKNNLQLFSSLYELRVSNPDVKDLKQIVEEGQNRIQVMALVHDMFYQSNNDASILMEEFIKQIVAQLNVFSSPKRKINSTINCDEIYLDLDTALPLGLILNELLTNSFKHATIPSNTLYVKVTLSVKNNFEYQLIVADNGNRIERSDLGSKSFGINMINILSKQLLGKFEYIYSDENRFIVIFKDSVGRKLIP